jgi:multiple antibiotic resistance protein|tara:strand:+ start:276 stop:902 length:627 start_codon:yes stop_codon:yes gene_type:complete
VSLLNTGVAIFTIANPIGNLPIYLSFTNGERRRDRAIARSASATFLVALLLSTWIGNGLLEFFGISRAAFQAAGGLIVVLIGLSMLRSQPAPEHHNPATEEADQDSPVKGIVPLGIPLLAGPGTLTVVIADPLAATLPGRLEISLLVLVLTALVFAIFVVGERLSSRISASALQVLTKVMGLLLTAIAVEMLFSGFKAAFPVLAQGAS